ncbi:MAG: acyl dehydratase [Hyphomicrobiaceae bacterium]|jgi:acyl dehydratase
MAKEFELTDEMRAQIGTQSPPWDYEVTTTSVRAFARGVGYTDLVYYDVEAAKAAGYPNLPAPPTYLGTAVFIPGQCSETFSGPTAGQPSVDHGLKGILDGGTETEYHDSICAGDTLEVRSKLSDMKVRDSAAIGKMLIVATETTFTKKGTDKLAAIQRSQVVFY